MLTHFHSREYITITKTYPLAAAKAFQTLPSKSAANGPFHFVYVSGEGATFTPGLLTPFFGRIKGETELALAEVQKSNPTSFRATSVRPGFVDWTGHEEIKPFLPDLGVLKNVTGSIFSPIAKYAARGSWSPTEPLGRFLTGMATGMWDGALDGEGVERLPGGSAIVGNKGLRRVMGLDAVKGP